MATYQWIISFTTVSASLPTPPENQAVVDMVGKLFTAPSGIWLAGPQSVDDSDINPRLTLYQWSISLLTTGTTRPSIADVTTNLIGLFDASVSNVWLAGPQSVDDGPVEQSKGG